MELKSKELRYLCLVVGLEYNEKDDNGSLKKLLEFIESDKMTEELVKRLKDTNLGKSLMYDIINDKPTSVKNERGDCFSEYDKDDDTCKYCSINTDCINSRALFEQQKLPFEEEGKGMNDKLVTPGNEKPEVPKQSEAPKPEASKPEAPKSGVETASKNGNGKGKAPAKSTFKTNFKKEAKPKVSKTKKDSAQPKVKKVAAREEKKQKVSVVDLLKGIKLKDIKSCFAFHYEGCNLLLQRRAATKDAEDAVGLAIPKHHKEWIEEVKGFSIRHKSLKNHMLLIVPAGKLVTWASKPRKQ